MTGGGVSGGGNYGSNFIYVMIAASLISTKTLPYQLQLADLVALEKPTEPELCRSRRRSGLGCDTTAPALVIYWAVMLLRQVLRSSGLHIECYSHPSVLRMLVFDVGAGLGAGITEQTGFSSEAPHSPAGTPARWRLLRQRRAVRVRAHHRYLVAFASRFARLCSALRTRLIAAPLFSHPLFLRRAGAAKHDAVHSASLAPFFLFFHSPSFWGHFGTRIPGAAPCP